MRLSPETGWTDERLMIAYDNVRSLHKDAKQNEISIDAINAINSAFMQIIAADEEITAYLNREKWSGRP